jgi:hypothetical protein
MFQYGQRGQASELELDEANQTVTAKTKQGGVKTLTRFILPAEELKMVERPDIDNTVSTLEATHRSAKARFLTLVVPVPIDTPFPDIETTFGPEESGTIRIRFPEHPGIRVDLSGSDFMLNIIESTDINP